MRIEIIKVPAGPAPKWVRREEVGIRLAAIPMPPDLPEHNFISEETFPSRGGYIVEKKAFINALAQHSVPAAEWFMKHFPKQHNSLSFGPDEVKVVGF